jgi:hypothetical protein
MRSTRFIAATAAAFLFSLGLSFVHAQQPAAENSRVQAGRAFVTDQGIPLNISHQSSGSVALGSYLVNSVAGCNDCHTALPYTQNPFAGLGAPKQVNVPCYLSGGMAFGPFVSRDITPWENGMPAGLTFAQFEHVMRTGEDPEHPGQVLQVMPWPTFQTMTDQDLRAIYDYLSVIPAIPANTCGVKSE